MVSFNKAKVEADDGITLSSLRGMFLCILTMLFYFLGREREREREKGLA